MSIHNAIFLLLVLAAAAVAWYSFQEPAKQIDDINRETIETAETEFRELENTKQDEMKKEMMDSNTEETSLESVDERGGSAQATRMFSARAGFAHKVMADISDPQEGKFYEGWLVNPEEGDFVSTGKMTKNNDDQWVLSFTADKDKTAYTKVVITEETEADGLDNKPELHVLEGDFKTEA